MEIRPQKEVSCKGSWVTVLIFTLNSNNNNNKKKAHIIILREFLIYQLFTGCPLTPLTQSPGYVIYWPERMQ